MRKKNSVCDFASQRSEALLYNFRQYLAAQSQISAIKAFHHAAEAPAPRFWVSEVRATRVIYNLLKGIDLTEGMLPEKRRMYQEILRRVKEAMEKDPGLPLGDIVFDVVNSPAPSSYLGWDRAMRLINKAKKQPHS